LIGVVGHRKLKSNRWAFLLNLPKSSGRADLGQRSGGSIDKDVTVRIGDRGCLLQRFRYAADVQSCKHERLQQRADCKSRLRARRALLSARQAAGRTLGVRRRRFLWSRSVRWARLLWQAGTTLGVVGVSRILNAAKVSCRDGEVFSVNRLVCFIDGALGFQRIRPGSRPDKKEISYRVRGSLLRQGDIVVTDRGFMVFRGLAADGINNDFVPIPNPLPTTRR